ncbi:response regulator [Motilimonas cestriensis]|uniref:histidine kinase n=1 Tax=Motilimonas cestriensis TaxID=2742685 RepID=A0ABS8W9K3_9GAMM|nr:ATP-binding protein [Motilimonas cestriensis]MCE2594893.1 response regulator [Motilimonas cestriensis]
MSQTDFQVGSQIETLIETRVFNAMTCPILICDAMISHIPITYVNFAFESMCEEAADQIIDKPCLQLLNEKCNPEGVIALRQGLQESQLSKQSFYNEELNVSVTPLYESSQPVAQFLLQFNTVPFQAGITAETSPKSIISCSDEPSVAAFLLEELTERERLFQSAFSQAAVGIARLDLSGLFIEVNEQLCQYLGYKEQKLLEMNIGDVTLQQDVVQNTLKAQMLELVQKREGSFNLELQFITLDKRAFWANFTVSVVTDQDHKPKYFTVIIDDIESIKHAEAELLRSKQERDHLLECRTLASEAGGICNWSINIKTQALYWDSHMYKMYGVPFQENLTYQAWRDTLHPDDLVATESAFFSAIANNCPFKYEFRIVNQQTGDIRWVKASAYVVYKDDEPSEAFGVNIDVTQEHELNKLLTQEAIEAQQENQAKSRFLATMSHEIRTPMNGVIGMIELLRETEMSNEQIDMLDTISDSSFALLNIINDILDFSKIEAGKMPLERLPISVLELIEKTADVLSVSAHNNGVSIFINVDLSIPEAIYMDPNRVRQILINLVGNAIKFSKQDGLRKGKVILRAQYFKDQIDDSNSNIVFEVEDNGVGMSTAQLKDLFSPFIQADNSTTRKFGGTGLGLSITHSLVTMMGGKVDVESELGNGAIFRAKLPAKVALQTPLYPILNPLKQWWFLVECDDKELEQVCLTIIQGIGCSDKVVQRKEIIFQDILPRVIVLTDGHYKHSDFMQVLQIKPYSKLVSGWVDQNTYRLSARFIKPTQFINALHSLIGEPLKFSKGADGPLDKKQTKRNERTAILPILVAEDHPTNLKVIQGQLSHLGYQYVLCSNGLDAYEKWLKGKFSLLLTDWHMPKMDGLQLTKKIRETELKENRPSTKIVAITANGMSDEVDAGLAVGMNDYMVKPLELNILENVIAKWTRATGSEDKALSVQEEIRQPIDQVASNINIINYNHLHDMMGSEDHVLISEILAMFWDGLVNDVSNLRQIIDTKAGEKLKHIAHGARGASHSSGAFEHAKLFKALEEFGGDWVEAEQLMEQINLLTVQMKRYFQTQGIIK